MDLRFLKGAESGFAERGTSPSIVSLKQRGCGKAIAPYIRSYRIFNFVMH